MQLVYAQGCSDAGICSIGNTLENKKEFKNFVEIGTIFGAGEADITYISPYISYTRTFSEKFSLSTKIIYSQSKGSFGSIAAFGDGFIIGNYNFKSTKISKLSALAGVKFPFNNGDLKINNGIVPLDYQSSLGTVDLIFGANLNYKNWDFNTGFQIPVINNNKNTYFSAFSNTNDFPSTNLFNRKSDFLFRTTYTFKQNKFTFKPNVLFLYHLGEDSYVTILNNRVNISGSDGLTVNGNIISSYAINNRNSIELSLATPFVIRDIRPDGLTREFTAGIIYKVLF